MKQLRLGDQPANESHHGAATLFLTDPEIVRRIEAVETALRSIIRNGADRPFVAVGQAADDLRRLAQDIVPEVCAVSAGAARRGIDRDGRFAVYSQVRTGSLSGAPASLGCADVIALRLGSRPRLIEVKSTAQGPYETLVPLPELGSVAAARLAGADALLAWWPSRGKLIWIPKTSGRHERT